MKKVKSILKAATKRKSPRNESHIPDPADGREFDALSDADKEKLFNYYETHPKLTGLRKPSKSEQRTIDAQVDAEIKKRGRPVVGEGSRQIAVTIETGLLRRVDAYVKTHGIKRAQLIAASLTAMIDKPRKSA